MKARLGDMEVVKARDILAAEHAALQQLRTEDIGYFGIALLTLDLH